MENRSEPNVVPLCDILLVLLIIFMVITPLTSKGFDIKLPDLGPNGADQVVVTMERNGILKINQEEYQEFEAFKERLEEIFRYRMKKVTFLKADEKLLYKDVIKVIDAIKGAGIEIISVIPTRYEGDS